jgi:hypothetical protein
VVAVVVCSGVDRKPGAGIAPGEGPIAVAVVGENALDVDAVLAVEGDGSPQEGDAVSGALART